MKKCVVILWFVLASTAPVAQTYHGVAVAPDGQNAWVVAIDTVLVAHTTDFGQTWRYENLPTFRSRWDICCIDGLTAWTCGMSGDIWQTTDGGDSWVRQNLGGPKHAARIRFTSPTHGWAAGGDMVQLSTTNGGQEWNQKLLPNPPFPSETTEYNGVAFVSETHGWIVAGRWPVGDTYAGGQGYVAKTTDRGDNWELQRKDTTYDFYDCWFADAQNGWVVGGDDRDFRAVVLRTTDGGASWQQQAVPAAARFLRSVCFTSPDEGWACGRSGTIIHTTDGGQMWTVQPTGVDTTLFDIEFADPQRGMVAGNSVVMYTTDGGQTWVRCLVAIAENGSASWRQGPALTIGSNPATAPVRFGISGYGGYRLTVFDALGREVRTMRGFVNSGGCQAAWDGRGAHGSPAYPGVYLARLCLAGETRTVRFTWLR